MFLDFYFVYINVRIIMNTTNSKKTEWSLTGRLWVLLFVFKEYLHVLFFSNIIYSCFYLQRQSTLLAECNFISYRVKIQSTSRPTRNSLTQHLPVTNKKPVCKIIYFWSTDRSELNKNKISTWLLIDVIRCFYAKATCY